MKLPHASWAQPSDIMTKHHEMGKMGMVDVQDTTYNQE